MSKVDSSRTLPFSDRPAYTGDEILAAWDSWVAAHPTESNVSGVRRLRDHLLFRPATFLYYVEYLTDETIRAVETLPHHLQLLWFTEWTHQALVALNYIAVALADLTRMPFRGVTKFLPHTCEKCHPKKVAN